MRLFDHTDHETLGAFFGEGSHNAAQEVFQVPFTPIWNHFLPSIGKQNIGAFRGKGLRKSFYYFGSSGMVAFFLKQWFGYRPQKCPKQSIRCLRRMICTTNAPLYYKVEPMLVNRVASLALDSHLVQSMLGVPHSQQEMAEKRFRTA